MATKKTVHALVRWVNDENKTSIEPIENIYEGDRFIGSINQVKWSADNQRYPAEVLFLSDKMSSLESEEKKFLAKWGAQPNSKRKRVSTRVSGATKDSQISAAVGEKQQVPHHLQSAKAATSQTRRENSKAQKNSQINFDKKLLAISRNIDFGENPLGEAGTVSSSEDSDDEAGTPEKQNVSNSSSANKTDIPSENLDKVMKTCSCEVCKHLKKFDGETCRAFLRSLSSVYKIDESMVELSKNKDVFIPIATKNQIKVDCQNQANKIIKETLFALFGREIFRQVVVTARGNRPGTYGIRSNVLEAILGFVNRNCSQKMTTSDLVNKRAQDWRNSSTDKNKGLRVSKLSSEQIEQEIEDDQAMKDDTKIVGSTEEHVRSAADVDFPSSVQPGAHSEIQELLSDLFPISSNKTPVKVTSTKVSVEALAGAFNPKILRPTPLTPSSALSTKEIPSKDSNGNDKHLHSYNVRPEYFLPTNPSPQSPYRLQQQQNQYFPSQPFFPYQQHQQFFPYQQHNSQFPLSQQQQSNHFPPFQQQNSTQFPQFQQQRPNCMYDEK